ncbi:hypothetical protein GDO81_009501 [Engystomops pustulosus]|uniref:Uncharacterized protein n=1 Tax=Engystomops pustulosus TaxID=76066 RepID=A0AAV7BRD5_ENGPU|nr:hypothetical protein GDO81_009501 [Engystomops pustulosus]
MALDYIVKLCLVTSKSPSTAPFPHPNHIISMQGQNIHWHPIRHACKKLINMGRHATSDKAHSTLSHIGTHRHTHTHTNKPALSGGDIEKKALLLI